MSVRIASLLAACGLVLAAPTIYAAPFAAPDQQTDLTLQGTWVMESAYEIRADGTRTTAYGEHPSGLLMVDSTGRYTLQIFRVGRTAFASGDKSRGQPDEYRDAALGSSTHFGRVKLDAANHRLMFEIESASFPNWDGKQQVRDYRYENGTLTYAVPAAASGNGTIAYSVWKKVRDQ
jgi:hypothetical protein